MNKWQMITLTFVQTTLSIYIDGQFKLLVKIPISISNHNFNYVSFFNDEMVGQCSFISVFSKEADKQLLSRIIADKVEFTTIAHDPSILMLYSARFVENDKLSNIIQNHYGEATSNCEVLNFVASFQRIFKSSKGLNYLITLFSQVHFVDYEGKKSSAFVKTLFDALSVIMRCSKTIQKTMANINAFEVISYFLYQADKQKLDTSIWEHIFLMEPSITDLNLMEHFQHSILLNEEIWLRTDQFDLNTMLSCYQRSIVCNPQIFNSVVSFYNLIEIYYTFTEKKLLDDQLYAKLSFMLNESTKAKFDQQMLQVLQQLIVELQNNETAVLPLIKVLKICAKRNSTVWENILRIEINQMKSLMIKAEVIKSLPKEYLSNALFVMLDYYHLCTDEEKDRIFEYFIQKAEEKDNLQLLVFYLAFSFIDENKAEKAAQVNEKILRSNKSLKCIKNLDPTAFSVIILFYLFCATDKIRTLAEFISHDINSVKECFSLIMIMSDVSGMNFHPFMSELMKELISIIFDIKSQYNEAEKQSKFNFFVYFVSLLVHNRKFSAIENHKYVPFAKVELKSFILLLSSYVTMSKVITKNEYGLSFDENGFWIDDNNAFTLIQRSFSLFGSDECVSSIHFMILLSFVYARNITKGKREFLKLIYEPASKSSYNAPFLVNIFANNDLYDIPTLKSIDMSTVNNALNVMEQFHNEITSNDTMISFEFAPKIDLTDTPDQNILKQVIQNTQKRNQDVFNMYERHWHRLWQSVSHQRSPFISNESFLMETHYKRGNHFDAHMCPMLLLQNNHFDIHAEASIKRGGLTEAQYQEIMKQDEYNLKNPFFFRKEKSSEEGNDAMDLTDFLWKNRAERIKILSQNEGDFYVTEKGYIFTTSKKNTVIKRETVRYVFWSWVNQRPEGVQIFTTTYKSYTFRFPGQENHKFVQNLQLCSLPNCLFFQENAPNVEVERFGLTQKWIKRQISNYDYIVWLNILSGRSFDDSRIYPVFPFIVRDMETEKLDFSNEKEFRDLSQNCASMNPDNLSTIRERIQMLKSSNQDCFCFPSLYSNAYILNHYLIRVEPFTTLHIVLQDGHFDVAARLFISFDDMMSRIQSKMGSIRELTPEFYALPEFLLNIDKFNFGSFSDDGVPLNDVGLPKWAKTPQQYIDIHRRVLESEFVSQRLNTWIDLIWGCKATGRGAEEVLNTFDPCVYPDVWEKPRNKFMGDDAVTAMLNTVGQIPHTLFTEPHPKRQPLQPQQRQTHAVVLHNIPEPISCAVCFGVSFEKMKVYAVLTSGRVFCLRLAATNFEIQMQRKLKMPQDRRKVAVMQSQFSQNNDQLLFCFAQDKSAKINIINVEKATVVISKASPHLSHINCISVCGNLILSGGADACATLWSYEQETKVEPLNFMMAHRKSISCCFLSETFGIAVTCSIDHTVIVSVLPDFTFLRAMELNVPDSEKAQKEENNEPSSVVVTNELGYIIVFFGRFVESFTLNGLFIKMSQIEAPAVTSCAVSPRPGIEYVAVLTANSNVLLLDTFTLEIVKVVWKGTEKIVDMKYHKDSQNYMLITESANVIFVPAIFPSCD